MGPPPVVGRLVSQRLQLAAPRMQKVGGGLQETGPEHPGSPTLSLQAHGLQQLSVTSPQEASSPFTSNQVLGNVQGLRELAGKGLEERQKLVLWKGKCPRSFIALVFPKKISVSKSG